MIKILLVDDEKIIRKGLAKIIEKLGSEFLIAGEAGNGEMALEMIAAIQPDIVISDIRMPKLDGLQLIEILNTRYPDIKKIVLSGFDDFEYARKAMRFKATDYLLKPVDELGLLELLKKTAEAIRAETESRSAAARIKERHDQSLPVLREIFLRELAVEGLYRSAAPGVLDSLFRKHEIDLGSRTGKVILINAEPAANLDEVYAEWRPLVERCLADAVRGYTFTSQTDLILIYGIPDPTADPTRELCRSLQMALQAANDCRFTISSGQTAQEPTELKSSYDTARRAQSYRFYCDGTMIFSSETLANPFNKSLPSGVVENFNNQIASIYETLNHRMLTPVIRDMLATFQDLRIEPAEVRRILEDAFNNLRINNPRFRQAVEEEYGAAWQFANELNRRTNLNETGEFLIACLAATLTRMQKNAGHKDKRIIEVVRSYIQEHYQQEITLHTLSQIAYISPNYLSEVFKEQTGESVVDYITRLRILKAKELLKDIRVKVYEVGKLVGFEDPAYFSKVFRKVVGVSPAEYRNLVN